MDAEKIKKIDEQINELSKVLNKREKTFCEEYLKTGFKKQAAINAGYLEESAAVQASRLLKKDKVLAYTHALQARAREELGIDDNWAVLKALDIYNRCMQAVPVEKWDYIKHKMVKTGEYQFDSKGALGALKMISDILGIGEEDKSKLMQAVTIINNNVGDTDE